MFGNVPSGLEPGIFLGGGAEHTGTTDLIRTAGAIKLCLTPPSSALSGEGLTEHKGVPVLILGGAGICAGEFCGLSPIDNVGPTDLIVTGGALVVDLKLLWELTLGGHWFLRLGLAESKPE
ncbi:hypothetical protein TorRG33x02_259190 [Trema orientale]|uniref:Uncharacterized protein n=1 Tax=Trema orientale TaxID=63057 RepID=A0A2P5D859_TREOI|nr:hypothetical protein TorRG33x02_259190 [Trema orientale]